MLQLEPANDSGAQPRAEHDPAGKGRNHDAPLVGLERRVGRYDARRKTEVATRYLQNLAVLIANVLPPLLYRSASD